MAVAFPSAFHLLAKPTGAVCNLDCSYCFFLSKEMLYPGSRFRMADELLETYLQQLIEAHAAAPEVMMALPIRRDVRGETVKDPIECIVSGDLAGVTDASGLCLDGTWKIQGAKAAVQEKSVYPAGVSVESHDLSGVVDPGGVRKRRARYVNALENVCLEEKTMADTASVSIDADYTSGIVDPVGFGVEIAPKGERTETVSALHEPVNARAVGKCSYDLSGIVDPVW
jgi:hypothetical protein